ncbi:MAG: DUF4445 domain-containing protein [Oscillospiraceae bacterium]|nr:DUF4445 domain-containing protein [Oscillospiraceae bacterium]
MKITVTDGIHEKSHQFREGTRASEIITELGFSFPMPCGGTGRCGKCRCKIDGKTALACKTPLFCDAEIKIPLLTPEVAGADDCVSGADGIAIDIGTTTVAAARFEAGRPTATIGRQNPQCAYGADVISRIGAKNTEPLTSAIRGLVSEIRSELGPELPTVITGNTAMLALYGGMDVSGMGVWPFEPPSLFDTELDGAYIPPCVSAFVGADALCSLLYSGAANSGGPSLVADLGTNGELLLLSGGRILVASAAAGPALEGVGVSCGMAAGSGAVYRVSENGCAVIGEQSPLGVCGSGLIDAIALMLKSGVVDSTGLLPKSFELPKTGLYLTQSDVRAFQLCKAAIAAGAETLLSEAGLRPQDLSRVYLSGALGKNVNVENACATGLLPNLPADRFSAIGNGALLGAAMLLNPENRDKLRSIARRCETVNLANDPEFMDKYIENMNF